MMYLHNKITLALFIWLPALTVCTAQKTIFINLPDAEIMANKVVRGDGDTYGQGEWSCSFQAEVLDDARIKISGAICFREKAGDHTVIVGEYERIFSPKELKPYVYFKLETENPNGSVRGPNIGARGYRWFNGEGLIQKALIQTDTFGDDTGRIGGTVKFQPLKVVVQQAYAFSDF